MLASGVEASRLGSTVPGVTVGGGRRIRDRPGVERGKGLGAGVQLQDAEFARETVILTLVQ